jgi:hypothetical protein
MNFTNLTEVATHFRNDLTGNQTKERDFILFFAHNGIGKTRLSMEFKEIGKTTNPPRDTLYFNAFTEDLFVWNNDLDNDTTRELNLNTQSAFFDGLQELDMDTKIVAFFHNYADIDFDIDYEKGKVIFSRSVIIGGNETTVENIKISRGEENLFIWSFFLAICQLAIDEDESYNWVKYIYIDDPITSLDENNAIAVACDLANLLKTEDNNTKTVISTHHSLFFNVMFNEMGRKKKHIAYHLNAKESENYTLTTTGDTPFFHHISTISELKTIVDSNSSLYTYHFNALRSILEKTASFFGYDDIKECLTGFDGDTDQFNRALNLFSHGKYSLFSPEEMNEEYKMLFKKVFKAFTDKYKFNFPEIFNETIETVA